ncbi:MAG: UDP-N-acetylmuramate--L-alanine ligase [Bacteriovoracaceae bacterium]|nr:UDP-N-acetylmuramate--L-alanine ligase [Bacteriovoracaceae bacterium]
MNRVILETRKEIKVHFVGIGGIGMSGIAEVLLTLGFKVTGSDMQESDSTKRLSLLGAEIFIGHYSDNVSDVSVVVYTSAVRDDNPEIIEAKRKNIPVIKRAEMLAELMRLKCGVAVAGTHGKTTTTGMLATILKENSKDPSYMIGGVVTNLAGHAKVGKGDYLVAEADESDGSFLLLNPIMSIITNIDADHMDYYGTNQKLVAAFDEFANKIPFFGSCALNIHDDNLMNIKRKMKKPSVTFGIDDGTIEKVDYLAKNISHTLSGSIYDLYYRNDFKTKVRISIPGRYNILNSLGAIAISHLLGIDFESISRSMDKFDGIGRRFNVLYSDDCMSIVDDYAHHPTAISTFLRTLKEISPESKIIALFEPHRYTRTRDCWNQFHHCFNYADELYLGPIYAASEKELPGIDSEALSCDINKIHPNFSKALHDMYMIRDVIRSNRNEKVVVAAFGAGSVSKVIKEVVKELE